MSVHKYLMDTHVWIWWQARPEALSTDVKEAISETSLTGELLLAAISVWEVSRMIADERLVLSLSPEDWITKALDIPGLRLVNLSPEIALESTSYSCKSLPDTVSQIVAATARKEGATILTKNQDLHDNRYVRAIW